MANGDTGKNQAPPQEDGKVEAPGSMPETLKPAADIQSVSSEMLTAYNQQKQTEAAGKKQRAEKDLSALETINVG